MRHERHKGHATTYNTQYLLNRNTTKTPHVTRHRQHITHSKTQHYKLQITNYKIRSNKLQVNATRNMQCATYKMRPMAHDDNTIMHKMVTL